MKKPLLSALCITATGALFVAGCANQGAVSLTNPETPTIVETTPETVVTTPTLDVTPAEDTPVTPNVETPVAPKEEAPVKPVEIKHPEPPKPVIYTVTAGDSISAIAYRFGLHQPDILALNPSVAKKPNAIRIGQKLKLPAGTDITIKAKPRAKKPATTKNDKGSVYVVKAGDVLGGIAIRHGVKIADIKKANNLKKDTIFVGQKLTIPERAARPKKPVVTPKDTDKRPVEKKTAEATPKAPVKEEAPTIEEITTPNESGEIESLEEIEGLEEIETPVANEAPEANVTTYTVKEGEDLLAVACRWNISVFALRAANNISDAAGYTLTPGTKLIIPTEK